MHALQTTHTTTLRAVSNPINQNFGRLAMSEPLKNRKRNSNLKEEAP